MEKTKAIKLVVQIPAYNEEEHIGLVIKEIPRSIPGIADIKVLVIDDGSTDKTIEVARKAGAHHILHHYQNKGLGLAFKHGLDKALTLGADIIVNIDADNQFNPKEIPLLIQPILEKRADMVTCSRFISPQLTKNMPTLKKWGNRRFTNLINRLTGQKFTDTQCGFRAYNKEAALRLTLQGKFTYTQEVFLDLASKGLKIVEIPLTVRYNPSRKSIISGNLLRYGFKTLGIITRATRDSQPLTFFGLPAIILFTIGFIGGLFSFFYWLYAHVTTPIRMLFNVSVYFMIFGVALAMLALIADMLLTLKRNQEELLYRIKKSDLEHKKYMDNGNSFI